MTGSDGEVRVYRIVLAALAERLAAAGETELADAAASRLGELGGPLDSNLPQEDD